MGRIEKTVFISYRRTNLPWAMMIYQSLTQHGYDVFFDYKSIHSGDFEQIILGNIRARAHFIVLLTPSALQRCKEPDDWLRREIEAALENKRNIVPLMMEGFNFASPSIAKYLTGKLALLKSYNGLNVPADYFDEAMERLRDKYLNTPLEAVLHPLSNTAVKAAQEQQAAANKATQVEQKELSAQEWFEKGFILNDNSDEEMNCYREALRLKPDYPEAYHNLGAIFESRRDWKMALEHFSNAVRVDPRNSLYILGRGNAHRALGNLDDAIKDYSEAIRLKPDYASAFFNRGFARDTKGDRDGAVKDYTEAIRFKPDYADAYNNRAIVRFNQGDLKRAIEDYTEAIRHNPDYTDAYNNRGLAFYNQDNVDAAIKDYSEAIRLKPDYADAYNNRGAAYFKKGNFAKAAADFEAAVRIQPDYTLAQENLKIARANKK